MARQTVTVQLTTSISSVGTSFLVNVGIFDPDGRLVASDYSRVDMTQMDDVKRQFSPPAQE